MKDKKLLYVSFLLPILFCSTNSLLSNEIHYIIDGTLNGTAAIVNLSELEGNYAYFSFDFAYHSELVPNLKDVAFFGIYSDIGRIKDDSVTYTFSEKEWSDLKIDDVKNLEDWKGTNIQYKEKNENEEKNYYKLTKINDEKKTLLLRVFISEKTNSDLMVENVLELPPGSNSKSQTIFTSKLFYMFLFLLILW